MRTLIVTAVELAAHMNSAVGRALTPFQSPPQAFCSRSSAPHARIALGFRRAAGHA